MNQFNNIKAFVNGQTRNGKYVWVVMTTYGREVGAYRSMAEAERVAAETAHAEGA